MTHRAVGARVIAWLNDHRLVATPDHYEFAYRYLFGNDAALRSEVDAIIDGGVRISPRQIEALAANAPSSPLTCETVAPQLDHIAAALLDIIGTASQGAGRFGTELTLAARALIAADAENVHQIIARMIAQAQRAEAGLADMSRQIGALSDAVIAATNGQRGVLARPLLEAQLRVSLALRPSSLCFGVVTLDQLDAVRCNLGSCISERLLYSVAGILHDRCGPHRIGRWAENALAIVFKGVTRADATALLDAARADLAARNLKTREDHHPIGDITLSAGLVAARGDDAMTLMASAQALALSAQRAGGNVTHHRPS